MDSLTYFVSFLILFSVTAAGTWLVYFLPFIVIFFVAAVGTWKVMRLVRSPYKDEEPDPPPELDRIIKRAEKNAQQSEEQKKRIQRLEYAMRVQGRIR